MNTKRPMNSKYPGNPRRPDVDWGNEVAKSLKVVGKIILKVFSYIVNILLTILLIGIITGTVVGGTFLFYVKNYIDADIDDFSMITATQNKTTRIFYMDWTDRINNVGVPVELADQRIHGSENRMWASYQDIPKYLQNAFVAIEDKRFFEHHGIDILRTAKATINYFFYGTGSYGASTITQQLIKNVTGDDDVTIQRKVQEIMRALKLEETKDKTEILEMYLNLVPLSQGCYGVQAAAYTYFGKDVSKLTLIECAAIAAITQAPTKWDPIQNPENNAARRDLILEEMLKQGYITQGEFNEAYGKELVLNVQRGDSSSGSDSSSSVNSWYKDAVIEECITLLSKKMGFSRDVASRMIYTAGYDIYTAMDPSVQETLENYYENDENFPKVDASPIQPESSMVVMDPYTGDVLGLVGGRGQKSGNRILNYATQTTRSPGSSIKPLSVYGPALEYGVITYGSVLDDTPVNFGNPVYDSGTGKQTGYSIPEGYPKNLPNRYKGLTTINDAVTRSVNTISVKVLQKLTLATSFDYVKNKLHMDSFIESRQLTGGTIITDMDYSPLGLGGMNYGVTVLEMAAAYCIFPNSGVYTIPRIVLKILDSDGNVVIDNTRQTSIVMSAQNASIMTKMLQNVVASGTASAITLDSTVNVAGKTGTTTSDNDRWFVGYTPYYVGAVWFGYAMPKSLSSFSATVSPSVVIWDNIMKELHQKVLEEDAKSGFGTKSFTTAQGVVTATYCKDSGKLCTDACRADPRGSRAEVGYFTQATVPTQPCDVHTLVKFDKSTGGVATEYCPESDIVYYGLLRVNTRNFPYSVVVEDAQYVARDLPGGIQPGGNENQPYFISTIPIGSYVGISAGGIQFNHACPLHTKPEETTAEEPISTDPSVVSDPLLPGTTDPETQPDNSRDNSQDNSRDNGRDNGQDNGRDKGRDNSGIETTESP